MGPVAGAYAIIGRSIPKVDGLAKASGATKYADDLDLPGMLFGRTLRSPLAHARIVRLDASRALARRGVRAVITGRDLPIPFGVLPISHDEHALALDKVTYVGEPVAAVAAVDEETAQTALDEIVVDYEPLPALLSIEDALAREDVRIQDHGPRGNVHKQVGLQFGDVEAGFAEADYVREDLFFYGGSNHLAMEQHAAVAAVSSDGRLTIWSSTQTPHYLLNTLSEVLGMPVGAIRVIATPNGGGFGGKSEPFSHEVCAAKLAIVTGFPVKFTLTREEVFYTHRGRHPTLMWIKTGVKRDGTLTAMHFRSVLDGGANSSYGVITTYYTGALQTTTYRLPAYRFEGVRVFTNKPICGPKRGHGMPQPRYALEIQLDKIAADLGLDPVELRLRQVVDDYSLTVNHLQITTCGLRQCIEQVVERSGYRAKRGRLGPGRGVGLACAAMISGAGTSVDRRGSPHSTVEVRIDRDGVVTVLTGAVDIGQGSDSILVSIAAEELGVDPGAVRIVTADSDVTPVDLGAFASRVTLMTGNATLDAARRLRESLVRAAAEELGVAPERLVARGGRIADADDPDRGLALAEAARLVELRSGSLRAVGTYTPPPRGGRFKGAAIGPSPAYSYSACVVEVTCDAETGEVRVDKVWVAHDPGKALNPMLVESQAHGCVYMALGEALMEDQAYRKDGHHQTPSMLEYKSPTMLEMPEVETIIVETHDPEGPYGAKEASQGPMLAVTPAIANAVYDALGVRVDEVPITPEKILKALQAKARGREPRYGPTRMPDVPWPPPLVIDPPRDGHWNRS